MTAASAFGTKGIVGSIHSDRGSILADRSSIYDDRRGTHDDHKSPRTTTVRGCTMTL